MRVLAESLFQIVSQVETQEQLRQRNMQDTVGAHRDFKTSLDNIEKMGNVAANSVATHGSAAYGIRLDGSEWVGTGLIRHDKRLYAPIFSPKELLPPAMRRDYVPEYMLKTNAPHISAWAAKASGNLVLASAYDDLAAYAGASSWTTEPVVSKKASAAIQMAMRPFEKPRYYNDMTTPVVLSKSQLYIVQRPA